MRLLADFKAEKDANALADFMEVQGVEVVLRGDSPFAVWVIEDDDVERAQALLANFKPDETLTAKAADIRKKRAEDAKPLPSAVRGRGNAAVSRGALTMTLLGISILVAVTTEMGDRETEPNCFTSSSSFLSFAKAGSSWCGQSFSGTSRGAC